MPRCDSYPQRQYSVLYHSQGLLHNDCKIPFGIPAGRRVEHVAGYIAQSETLWPYQTSGLESKNQNVKSAGITLLSSQSGMYLYE